MRKCLAKTISTRLRLENKSPLDIPNPTHTKSTLISILPPDPKINHPIKEYIHIKQKLTPTNPPEQKPYSSQDLLMIAVIKRAMQDCKEEKDYSALKWILEEKNTHIFSFKNICECLHLSVETINRIKEVCIQVCRD